MNINGLCIPEVVVFSPTKYGDTRGFVSETYSKPSLAEVGIDIDFVQDNHALSIESGTVRGLHFQIPPFAQNKLVRVARGSIFDVAVDIRTGSPTFGQHASAKISADDWNQILVPIGFAHGFVTLEPNTEVIYKVSNPYSPEHDRGIFWMDPALGINWPIPRAEAVLSEKDKRLPRLGELANHFPYNLAEAHP